MVGVMAVLLQKDLCQHAPRFPGLLYSMPLTPQQATVDPCLYWRLLDTHRLNLLWGHYSFLLGPGAHSFVGDGQGSLECCSPWGCKESDTELNQGSSVHGDSPGKNTGVGCHALFPGDLPNPGTDIGLPDGRQILYCLSHKGRLSYTTHTHTHTHFHYSYLT